MAKIILVIVAVACAFVASNATPAIRNVEQQIQSAKLQSQFSGKLARGGVDWDIVVRTIEAVQKILDFILQETDETFQGMVDSAKKITELATQTALDAAAKWNSDANEWADKAAAAGVNIQDCLQKQSSLADVIAELKNDAVVCANDITADLTSVLDDFKQTVVYAQALLEKTKNQAVECSKNIDPTGSGVCFLYIAPTVALKGGRLLIQAAWDAGLIYSKDKSVVPTANLCASKAAGIRGNEASAITNATVQCIKEKLGN